MIESRNFKNGCVISYSNPFFYWYHIVNDFLLSKQDRTLVVVDEEIDFIIPQNIKNRIIDHNIKNFDNEYVIFSSTNIQSETKDVLIHYGWDRIIYILNNINSSHNRFNKLIISSTLQKCIKIPFIWILTSSNTDNSIFSSPLSLSINKILMRDNLGEISYIDDIIPTFKLFRTNGDIFYKNILNNFCNFIYLKSNSGLINPNNIGEYDEIELYNQWKEWYYSCILTNHNIDIENNFNFETVLSCFIPFTTCILFFDLSKNINIEYNHNYYSNIDYINNININSIYKEDIINSYQGIYTLSYLNDYIKNIGEHHNDNNKNEISISNTKNTNMFSQINKTNINKNFSNNINNNMKIKRNKKIKSTIINDNKITIDDGNEDYFDIKQFFDSVKIEHVNLMGYKNTFFFIPLSDTQGKNYKNVLYNTFKRYLSFNINNEKRLYKMINNSSHYLNDILNFDTSYFDKNRKYIITDYIIKTLNSNRIVLFSPNIKVSKSLYKYIKNNQKEYHVHNYSGNDIYDFKKNGKHIVIISENISLLWNIYINSSYSFDHFILWDIPLIQLNKKKKLPYGLMFDLLLLMYITQEKVCEVFWLLWENTHDEILIDKMLDPFYNIDSKINKLINVYHGI